MRPSDVIRASTAIDHAQQAIAESIQLIEIAKAAKRLDCSAQTVRRYIRHGWLPAVMLPGRHLRVESVALDRFIESRRIPKP